MDVRERRVLVRTAAVHENAAVSWLAHAAGTGATFAQVFGLCPELHRGFERFYGLFWQRRLVDPVVLELCRLQVAALLGCTVEREVRYRAAVEAGLTEAKVAELSRWRTSPSFSELERACLGFAQRFVTDVHGLTDEDVAAVSRLLGEPGTVALAEAIALFEGFCRFRLALDVQSEVQGTVPTPTAEPTGRLER